MSRALQDLANLHIFTARVDADGAGMTSNDGSATVATTSAGLFAITFGQAWLTAPTVLLTALDPTYAAATDGVLNASIVSITTMVLTIQTAFGGDAGADGVAVDAITHVVCVGLRNT